MTNRTRCRHPRNRSTTTTRPFTGPVSRRENPAAHGGCCYVTVCGACGAERRTNVNGNHSEAGSWSVPTDSEVIARAFAVVAQDDARERTESVIARARSLAPFQIFGAGGRTLTLSLDPETFEILVAGPHTDSELPGILGAIERNHGEWLAAARAARETVRTADLAC